jgi:hypothetical protein
MNDALVMGRKLYSSKLYSVALVDAGMMLYSVKLELWSVQLVSA